MLCTHALYATLMTMRSLLTLNAFIHCNALHIARYNLYIICMNLARAHPTLHHMICTSYMKVFYALHTTHDISCNNHKTCYTMRYTSCNNHMSCYTMHYTSCNNHKTCYTMRYTSYNNHMSCCTMHYTS